MVKNLLAMQEIRFDPWVGKTPWKREWQPTPVFLPEESHRQKSLACYSPWGHKESAMTEQLTLPLLASSHVRMDCLLTAAETAGTNVMTVLPLHKLWTGKRGHQNVKEPLEETTHLDQARRLTLAWVASQQEGPAVLPPKNLTRRIWEGPKGGRRCHPIMWANLPETVMPESIMAERCACHQGGPWVRPGMGQTRWLLITMKPEITGSMQRSSWVPLLLLSAWAPLPYKVSCFVSTCVSLDSSFPTARQEPTLKPSFQPLDEPTAGDPPSCNKYISLNPVSLLTNHWAFVLPGWR